MESIRQKKYEYDKERGKRYKILQNENLQRKYTYKIIMNEGITIEMEHRLKKKTIYKKSHKSCETVTVFYHV